MSWYTLKREYENTNVFKLHLLSVNNIIVLLLFLN